MTSFEIKKHGFTQNILSVLEKHFGLFAHDIFSNSPLLCYLNHKTKSANRGAKSRASFANHYALYVIVEDYIQRGFFDKTVTLPYAKYEGARFSKLIERVHQLPFGARIENHALNARLNNEFSKFFPTLDKQPIVRNQELRRYWVQEDLLLVSVRDSDGKDQTFNISQAILDIIDDYVETKRTAFQSFLETCKRLSKLRNENPQQAIDFIAEQLSPSADARIFEIVSYAVLKARYSKESVWIGQTKEEVDEVSLLLYKTGRTNANDGGIDFVMKPLGRFFQVTETVDSNKYFLDIDKVKKFPITFVVKSRQTDEQIRSEIENRAIQRYKIESVIEAYMEAIEDIINIDDLLAAFNDLVDSGNLEEVMDEIVLQSKTEFNY